MAGLDPVLGFVSRTVEDLKLQIETDLINEISPSLDVSSTSPVGQFVGAMLKVLQELWALAQAEFVATDPDRNGGDSQDAVCAITGTTREPATHSQVVESVHLTIGTVLTVGSLVAVSGNPTAQFRFRGVEPATGDPVVEGNFTAPSTGDFNMRFEAVATGPIAANAGTLTIIVTPISGWTITTGNAADAVLGHDIEEDSILRIRREQELAALGSTPLDALQAELVQLLAANGVEGGSVTCFDNVNDTVDGAGRPGHSIEALVNDGSAVADDDIAQTIWNGRGGGIKTFGSSSGSAVGRDGISRTMNFNRPTLVPIYFAVTVVTDPSLFPTDGATQIKNAMVVEGRLNRKTGDDVVQSMFYGPVYGVTGVTKVTVLALDTAPAPVSTADIVIALRELATFDTGRIGVTVT